MAIDVNVIFTAIIAILGQQFLKIGPDFTEEIIKEPYDFIVVGAGSAGAVVAGRLSENANVRVLVIEAGSFPTYLSEIPGEATKLLNTTADWQYKTTPQTSSCFAYVNNQCSYPRGKVLGGSSTINDMAYVRGNHKDFDNWASLGNEGWSWEDVRPYFLKSEGNTIPWIANDTYYHNSKGPLTVSEAPFTTSLLKPFLEAGQENGFPIRDLNGQYQSGVMPFQFTMRNGARCSTYKAFLNEVFSRTNLKVITDSLVLKVLFDNERRAVGVSFSHKGRQYTAKANKEVILSAGAINSPQILMLSGVGPSEHLKRFNISVVVDLPGVGQNLIDHVFYSSLIWKFNDSLTEDKIQSMNSLVEWLFYRQGPLTSPFSVEGVGFMKSSLANQSLDWPDIQIITQIPSFSSVLLMYPERFPSKPGQTYFTIYPLVVRPKSVGSIQLQSSSPFDSPLIDPRYLTHPDDMKILVEATKVCFALVNSPSFKNHKAEFVSNSLPECANYTQQSDEYWACLARRNTLPGLHAVGTCKMGKADDAMAVVDSKLKVHNAKGLRVIDASIMPYITNGNTNAPTVMIGEMGSDLIKKEWDLL